MESRSDDDKKEDEIPIEPESSDDELDLTDVVPRHDSAMASSTKKGKAEEKKNVITDETKGSPFSTAAKARLKLGEGSITSFCLLPDGLAGVVHQKSKTKIEAYDLATQTCVAECDVPSEVIALNTLPDGRIYVAFNGDMLGVASLNYDSLAKSFKLTYLGDREEPDLLETDMMKLDQSHIIVPIGEDAITGFRILDSRTRLLESVPSENLEIDNETRLLGLATRPDHGDVLIGFASGDLEYLKFEMKEDSMQLVPAGQLSLSEDAEDEKEWEKIDLVALPDKNNILVIVGDGPKLHVRFFDGAGLTAAAGFNTDLQLGSLEIISGYRVMPYGTMLLGHEEDSNFLYGLDYKTGEVYCRDVGCQIRRLEISESGEVFIIDPKGVVNVYDFNFVNELRKAKISEVATIISDVTRFSSDVAKVPVSYLMGPFFATRKTSTLEAPSTDEAQQLNTSERKEKPNKKGF